MYVYISLNIHVQSHICRLIHRFAHTHIHGYTSIRTDICVSAYAYLYRKRGRWVDQIKIKIVSPISV